MSERSPFSKSCACAGHECVCIKFHILSAVQSIDTHLNVARVWQPFRFWISRHLLIRAHFKSAPKLHPVLPFNYKLCAGSTSQLTRHCLGSRPHSSLLITNEPAPASRFLQRLPVPPHLCHLLSPALSLSLSLPLPFPFSTLFRHTLASFVAESIRLAVCWVGSGERRRREEK